MSGCFGAVELGVFVVELGVQATAIGFNDFVLVNPTAVVFSWGVHEAASGFKLLFIVFDKVSKCCCSGCLDVE